MSEMVIDPGIDNSKIATNSWQSKNGLNLSLQKNREYLFAKRRASMAESATNFFDGKDREFDFTDGEDKDRNERTEHEDSDTDIEWSKVTKKQKKRLPPMNFFLKDKNTKTQADGQNKNGNGPTLQPEKNKNDNPKKRGAAAAELSPKDKDNPTKRLNDKAIPPHLRQTVETDNESTVTIPPHIPPTIDITQNTQNSQTENTDNNSQSQRTNGQTQNSQITEDDNHDDDIHMASPQTDKTTKKKGKKNKKNKNKNGNDNDQTNKDSGNGQNGQVEQDGQKKDVLDLAYDAIIELQGTVTSVNTALSNQASIKLGQKSTRGEFLNPIIRAFSCFGKDVNAITDVMFALVSEVGSLRNKVDSLTSSSKKVNETIKKNTANGNMNTPFEKSPVYNDVCDRTAECNRTVKMPNFDLGYQATGSKSQLANLVKDKMLTDNPNLQLNGVGFQCLATATEHKNGKHTLPILMKVANKDLRIALDKTLKTQYSTSFHWPQEVFTCVKEIRKQVEAYRTDTFIMKGHQIMIRPSLNGRTLYISYRDPRVEEWYHFDSVKTPVNNQILDKAKAKQPCKSNYFKL